MPIRRTCQKGPFANPYFHSAMQNYANLIKIYARAASRSCLSTSHLVSTLMLSLAGVTMRSSSIIVYFHPGPTTPSSSEASDPAPAKAVVVVFPVSTSRKGNVCSLAAVRSVVCLGERFAVILRPCGRILSITGRRRRQEAMMRPMPGSIWLQMKPKAPV